MQSSSIDGDLILMIFINYFFEMQMYHFKLFAQILILKNDFISDAVFRVVYCLYQQLCYTILRSGILRQVALYPGKLCPKILKFW